MLFTNGESLKRSPSSVPIAPGGRQGHRRSCTSRAQPMIERIRPLVHLSKAFSSSITLPLKADWIQGDCS